MNYLAIRTSFGRLGFSFLVLGAFLSTAWAFPSPHVEYLTWGDMDVVWLQDERFPIFHVSIEFAQGAAAESPAQSGLTYFTLNNLDLGTKRFTQKELRHNLEYYGISYGAAVGQISASYDFSGAIKFIPQTVQQICHLFTDATFPQDELANEKNKLKTSLRNLARNPEMIAGRALGIYTGENTAWANLPSGRWASIRRLQSADLKSHLQYLRQQVKKKLYLVGPKEVLALRDHLSACAFAGRREWSLPTAAASTGGPSRSEIIFIALPKSNQAKIMLGRYAAPTSLAQFPAAWLADDFLGRRGAMNSQLMKEIRVKYGLTYGIGTSLLMSKMFTRSSIMTSGRTEKAAEIITRVLQKIKDLQEGIFLPEELSLAQTGSARGVIFYLEDASSYLSTLVNLAELGGTAADLAQLNQGILQVNTNELKSVLTKIFAEPFKIIVVGHPSLKKVLAKQWPLREVKLQDIW